MAKSEDKERTIAELNSENEALRNQLKQAEAKIQSMDSQFRLLVENAPEAIFIQTEGKFAYVNEAALSLYGANSAGELLGTPILDRIPDEYKNFVADRITRLNHHYEKAAKTEFRHRKMDGTEFDVEVSAVPFNFKGKDGAMVFVNDITLRKKIESRLVERERILQLFVEYAPASIAMFDNEMHYLACSRRFLSDYQINYENIIGKSHYEIFPEISEDWKRIHRSCLSGNIERREADQFPRIDGSMDWVRWEMHPWYSEQNIIGGIILFSEVITDRKKAELEIASSNEKFRKAMEELRLSYDLLNNLTKQVPGVVYQYRLYPDGHSAFPYSSRGMWDIYEVTPEELKEDASPVFTRIHPDDYDYIVETITNSAKNQTLYESEFRVLLPQQGLRWRHCNARPEMMPDGSTLWYGIITDITARKTIEEELKLRNEELNAAKEKAEESDRLKTAFLQNMSHEIRTPMNAIVGFAGLVPAQFGNKAKLEHFSSIINQRCNDLLDIINDILDIAKIESGIVSINTGTCDLGLLLRELEDYYSDQKIKLNKQHIEFKMNMPDVHENFSIITDPVKLKQILINLISNSFKFTDYGKIEAGFTVKKDKLLFFVSDTGIGIAPDKHQMIFERFSQIEQDKSRLYGGTGLGLSIVKGLVKLLGGEIWLESAPGKGSRFFFTIDYKPFNESRFNETRFTEKDEYSFHGEKILIVEDDHFNSALLTEILEGKGLSLLYAENGRNSIKMAREHSPDIILMDIGLPDISGYEAIRQILIDNPSLLIIAQTAYAGQEDMKNAISAGCIDYLSKPINPDHLLKMFRKYIK